MEKSSIARKFIRHYGLAKTSLSVESLKKISRSMGYDVSCFNPNSKEHIDLLSKIGMQDYAKTHAAFTYAQNNKKIIFIVFYSSERDKIYLLLHEIAHLYLNHMHDSSKSETEKEEEANKFTHYVMKYKTSKIKFTYFIVSICVALLFMICTITYHKKNDSTEKYKPSQIIQITSSSNERVVLVTKTGTKYHLLDCHYIAGRTVFKLNIEEAKKAGYTACTYCRPDEL